MELLSWQFPQVRWQEPEQKLESYLGHCTVNWHLCAGLCCSHRERKKNHWRTQQSVSHFKILICFCEHLSFCLWTIIFPLLLPHTPIHHPICLVISLCLFLLSVFYFLFSLISSSFMYLTISGFPSCLGSLCSTNVSMATVRWGGEESPWL